MSGVCHAMLLVGIGAAAGVVVVYTFYLLRLALDLIAVGEVDQQHLWPQRRSLTVWTGVDWFTVTVMPVAFGRWGVAVCRDDVPRWAELIDLVGRARTERNARARAAELVGQAASRRGGESVGLLER